MKSKIKVVQKEGAEEIPTEIIAQSIKEISGGMKSIRAGKLNDRAIVLLLHASTGVASQKIKLVLNAMQSLEKDFLK